MIDPDTPQEFMTRTGFDGNSDWELVFSDEFNEDGRTFYEGDDPFWQGESERNRRVGGTRCLGVGSRPVRVLVSRSEMILVFVQGLVIVPLASTVEIVHWTLLTPRCRSSLLGNSRFRILPPISSNDSRW